MSAGWLVAEVTCPANFAVAFEVVEVAGGIERDAEPVGAGIGEARVDRASSNRLDVHSIAALEHIRVVDFVVAAALAGNLGEAAISW